LNLSQNGDVFPPVLHPRPPLCPRVGNETLESGVTDAVIRRGGTIRGAVGFRDWVNLETSRSEGIDRHHHRVWALLAKVVLQFLHLVAQNLLSPQHAALKMKEGIGCWGIVTKIQVTETEGHLRKDRLVHERVSIARLVQLHMVSDWKAVAEIPHGNEGWVSWNPSGVHTENPRSLATVSPRTPVPENVE